MTIADSEFIISDFQRKYIWELHFIKNISTARFNIFYNPGRLPDIITKQAYLKDCKRSIAEIRSGRFDKIVYSRVFDLPYTKPPVEIFQDLTQKYHNAFVYLLSIEGVGTWIGATPEVFLNIKKNKLETTSLAGTKTDHQQLWGQKEKEEQAMVTGFILSELKRYGGSEIEHSKPYTFDTGSVLHLKTDIKCRVTPKNTTDLIKNLHPTPATCGIPQLEAKNFISDIEIHDRGFYTGFIGSIDREGGIDLFVNLRCMQLFENRAYLYIGGGLTADSIPELEWEETENKAKTLSQFLN